MPHDSRCDAEALRRIIEAAPDAARLDELNGATARVNGHDAAPAWPEPDMRLVEDDRMPAPGLDDDALPEGWGEWISAEAAARGCPRDYVAGALIAAASAWLGNARHVAATATWTEQPHLWIALIGAPSAGKSPALRPFAETTREIEREAEPAWREARAQHAALAEAATAREQDWRESVHEATKQGKQPLDRPSAAEPPPPPPRPRLLAMDATSEELQRLLAAQRRGLLYLRDELSGWLGSMDRYGGHGADRAFFIECWTGGAYVADRVKHKGEPIRVERASLAILGGMQPDRLREALAGADDGLGARFLYVWPEPAPIGPLRNADDAAAAARHARLHDTARRLYALAMDRDPTGTLAPKRLRIDDHALKLFDELQQEARHRARATHGLAAGWHGKTPGRALRLALVFEFLAVQAGAEPCVVSGATMARAAAYLDYAGAMLDRVAGGLSIGEAEADAAVIARHILGGRAARLNERELYQVMAWLRDRGRRDRALGRLEEAGWIRRASRRAQGRPRTDWDINPSLREQVP